MFVSYCQYYLQGREFLTVHGDADTVGRIFAGNSLAAGGPEHLTVFAGTHTGWIRLTTEQCAEEPASPGLEWETSVDVSIYSTSGDLRVFRWGGDVEGDAGNFATAGEGWASGFRYAAVMKARGTRATTRLRSITRVCGRHHRSPTLFTVWFTWFLVTWLGMPDSYSAPLCPANVPPWWPSFIPA